jgi:hypothetical protein
MFPHIFFVIDVTAAMRPAGAPLGNSSAELATPLAGDGNALLLADYAGTRFDQITDLHYSTYRQSADAGNNLAVALQFNVDYDLTDASAGYQGRVVFEPYQGIGGNVPQSTWQTWDAKAGKWWGTKTSVPKAGVIVANPCVQATPCTWTQLLTAFPNAGVHATLGAVVLKAGSSWAGFRGNVDNFTIGIGGTNTTFDFELTSPPIVSPILMVLADVGVTGAPAAGDTTFTQGTVVPYAFHGANDGRTLRVYLDGVVVPESGVVQMNGDHALFAALVVDLTLQPVDQDLYTAIRNVQTAADPVSAFQNLLDKVASASVEVGSDETDARMRRASAAAIDLNRDSAALRRIDEALGGHMFEVKLGSAGRALPSRVRISPSRAAPGRPRSNSRLESSTQAADSTMFLYVNGVGNLYQDAAKTAAELAALLREDPRFADPGEIVVKFFYNRNNFTQNGSAGDLVRCMSALGDGGVEATVKYTNCRRMNPAQTVGSLVADLGELAGLLASNAQPTGPVAQDIKDFADSIETYRLAGRNVVIMPHSEGNVITQKSLQRLGDAGRFAANGTPTCVAVTPMASPATTYGPVPAKYIMPTQLDGDIVTLAHVVMPGAQTFPPISNTVADSLAGLRGGWRKLLFWKQLVDGVAIHGMGTYLSPSGGRGLVQEALRLAYNACMSNDLIISSPGFVYDGLDSLKVGETAQFTVHAFNGAGDEITNRPFPVQWSGLANGGVTVNSSGLATAQGIAANGVPGFAGGGTVVARAGAFEADWSIRVWSTPPHVSGGCSKGAPWWDGVWRYNRWDGHADATPTVPNATIVSISIELETARPLHSNGGQMMVKTSLNDGYTIFALEGPYFGYDGPYEGVYQPTGYCIINARDSFGKSTTVIQ